jgi:hypothetical protein
MAGGVYLPRGALIWLRFLFDICHLSFLVSTGLDDGVGF